MPQHDATTAKRRLAAVLSADAAGYSRLISENDEATIASLQTARAVFRERVSAHAGRIVDTAGDNVLAVFGSVVDALRAALEIQDELLRRNEPIAPQRRLQFRVGVNIGELLEQDDGTVYGDAVNIAARVQTLAAAGEISVSEVVFEEARGKVDAHFEFVGAHQVKNIARPVRVYRVNPQTADATAARALPLPSKPSIAVLPFANRSADPEQEYFSDGIADDLITALSRIRWLFVVARNSTFTFKGKSVDVKQIARDLGVRYVLEGSVRRGGNRVRITAQLIDGTTGTHVWAERYDRELADVFALQDEITETIAAAIEPELGHVERERAHQKPPESLDAWDLYQRGLWHLWQVNAADSAVARSLLERATALDPSFAPSFAALAFCHFRDHTLLFRDPSEKSLEHAFEMARRAVSLDDKDAFGHATLGRVYSAMGDHAVAIDELRTALRLNPSSALAHFGLGFALVLYGRATEALGELDLAARLSPHDPNLWMFDTGRVWALMAIGDFEGACDMARRSVRRPTTAFPPWWSLVAALGTTGRLEEGRIALARARELRPDFGPAQFEHVWPRADAAFFECFFDGIRKVDPTVADPRTVTSRRAPPRS